MVLEDDRVPGNVRMHFINIFTTWLQDKCKLPLLTNVKLIWTTAELSEEVKQPKLKARPNADAEEIRNVKWINDKIFTLKSRILKEMNRCGIEIFDTHDINLLSALVEVKREAKQNCCDC